MILYVKDYDKSFQGILSVNLHISLRSLRKLDYSSERKKIILKEKSDYNAIIVWI